MSFIDNFRKKYFYGALALKIKLLRIDKKISNLENIQTIGIIFDATEEKNVAAVKAYYDKLLANGKTIDLMGFVRTRKPVIFNFAWFGFQHTNWFHKPKGKEITRFINREYDLLINACLIECMPLEYISALSHATYKVGPYFPDKVKYFDLMPNMNPNDDEVVFFKVVDRYLNIINKKQLAHQEK